MSNSRREFLSRTAVGLIGAVAAKVSGETLPDAGAPSTAPLPTVAPPAFGTAPESGPVVTAQTFSEAQKLAGVELTEKDLALAASNWRSSMAGMHERRTGPRKVPLDDAISPAAIWNPAAHGIVGTQTIGPKKDHFARSPKSAKPQPLPTSDDAIAFSPVHELSRWIESRALTSERLTKIYLARLEKFQPQLNCAITICAEHALAQARAADAEIAHGKYRGPLHGIPWGAKDLLDTKGIATTWGAEPFRDRIPTADAVVTDRLNKAGAVLVAKLSLGALALNDIWFGGQTKNPWCLEEGSSGSSAGPGSATAAGLVGFAIGSETGGSIVSPSERCGVTGLRPTFGRVARTGAMTLCWSLDKLGPMARSVEDTLFVLDAIRGPDAHDFSSVPAPLEFDAGKPVSGLRVGYFPKWMSEEPATPLDQVALENLRKLGLKPVPVSLPDWPYDDLFTILFAESAAAFEELTLSHRIDALKMQVADAWPNLFRQARFLSAVDFVQSDRFRRKIALEMARVMNDVDLLIVPSLRDEMLTITNFTGHPSLTLRTGFIEIDKPRSDWAPDPKNPLPKLSRKYRVPHGVTLIGRLFDEGTIGRVGMALERASNVAQERPPGF
jgi:Asp-tRNA(Asn)/Glu-tRNA(Gln) amidotransferase A subunit family amidase